ncbi:MAG TPA: hypothetical protein VMH50_14320 [Thermoleophilia bacterium]|nr:hypothetical protein [Thermoleophilia bacterium]
MNRSTHAYVRVLGAALGLTATAHGIFEVRRGNQATDGHLLPDMGAFTLIANYRATGFCAMSAGVALSGWSLARMQSRRGAPVLLLLSTLAFLFGGGIAQVPVSLLVWGAATRTDSSLSWWERSLPPRARVAMAAAWQPVFVAGLCLAAAGIVLWLLVLPPGDRRKVGGVHYVLWSMLGCGLALLAATVPCGFARDIETRLRTIESLK